MPIRAGGAARAGDERLSRGEEVVGREGRAGVRAARVLAADEEAFVPPEVDADGRLEHLSG
jgi:hypothetical protein